jgi:hypothetical protein
MRRSFVLIFFVFEYISVYSQSKIIGGDEISIQKAPWTANMRIVNHAGLRMFNRSGTIISRNLVLTVSHNWPEYNYDHIEVHVGGSSENKGEYREVHRFIHHPDMDVTLLELSTPLDCSDKIQPIDYKSCEDESLYAPGTAAVIYGWGKNSLDMPATSLRLRSANVTIISREQANIIYGASVVPPNAIVSFSDSIKIAGIGDSGGPLVVLNSKHKPVLAGITMLTDTREESENSGLTVYCKVKSVIEWINSCKCELIGRDTVAPTGTLFKIANMPPEVQSVEWFYSGLIEIGSSIDYIDVIPEKNDEKTTGYIKAKIITKSGTLTIDKRLVIMPRIDIDVNVRYDEITATYGIKAKAVNTKVLGNKQPSNCLDTIDDVKKSAFVWSFDGEIATGREVFFEINPNVANTYTINVSKYDCDRTFRLEKTFSIQRSNEFVFVHNEPGIVIIQSMNMKLEAVTEKLQMTFDITDKTGSTISVNTSKVIMENTEAITKLDNLYDYVIYIYSRRGNLLFSSIFNNQNDPLNIDISSFPPDIYILYINNVNTGKTTSRMLIINP